MFKSKSLVGTRLRIEYFDQNDNFAAFLPRLGTIVRQITAEKRVKDWYLVELDEPFEYQFQNQNSFTFTLLNCEYFLIRSRWKGYKIGDEEPTSVYILLIKDFSLLKNEPIKVEQFCHVAWGMCHTDENKEL